MILFLTSFVLFSFHFMSEQQRSVSQLSAGKKSVYPLREGGWLKVPCLSPLPFLPLSWALGGQSLEESDCIEEYRTFPAAWGVPIDWPASCCWKRLSLGPRWTYLPTLRFLQLRGPHHHHKQSRITA